MPGTGHHWFDAALCALWVTATDLHGAPCRRLDKLALERPPVAGRRRVETVPEVSGVATTVVIMTSRNLLQTVHRRRIGHGDRRRRDDHVHGPSAGRHLGRAPLRS